MEILYLKSSPFESNLNWRCSVFVFTAGSSSSLPSVTNSFDVSSPSCLQLCVIPVLIRHPGLFSVYTLVFSLFNGRIQRHRFHGFGHWRYFWVNHVLQLHSSFRSTSQFHLFGGRDDLIQCNILQFFLSKLPAAGHVPVLDSVSWHVSVQVAVQFALIDSNRQSIPSNSIISLKNKTELLLWSGRLRLIIT